MTEKLTFREEHPRLQHTHDRVHVRARRLQDRTHLQKTRPETHYGRNSRLFQKKSFNPSTGRAEGLAFPVCRPVNI